MTIWGFLAVSAKVGADGWISSLLFDSFVSMKGYAGGSVDTTVTLVYQPSSFGDDEGVSFTV